MVIYDFTWMRELWHSEWQVTDLACADDEIMTQNPVHNWFSPEEKINLGYSY